MNNEYELNAERLTSELNQQSSEEQTERAKPIKRRKKKKLKVTSVPSPRFACDGTGHHLFLSFHSHMYMWRGWWNWVSLSLLRKRLHLLNIWFWMCCGRGLWGCATSLYIIFKLSSNAAAASSWFDFLFVDYDFIYAICIRFSCLLFLFSCASRKERLDY